VLVAGLNLGVTSCLFRHEIVLRFSGEGRVVEHFEDVEGSQPNIEASWRLESPMGHWLPHAFRADGSFIFTFEEAVSALVNRLYPGSSTPQSPQSQSTPKKVDRNAEIRAWYAAGMSVPDLAREYGISKNRVYQILRGKRK